MIPISVPVFLYLFAFLLISVLLAGLTLLYFKRQVKIIKFALFGLLAYVLAEYILAPLLWSLIAGIGAGGVTTDLETYWEIERHGAFLLIYSVLTALSQLFVFWFALKVLLKGNFRIYDLMAMGLAYRIFSTMGSATSFSSYARVAIAYNKGTLESLSSEALSLETLMNYVTQMQSGFFPVLLAQFLTSLVITLFVIFALLMIYNGVKTKKFPPYVYAFAALLLPLLLINFSEFFFGQTAAIVCLFFLIAAGVCALTLYMKWYKKQQAEYAKQMQEYKAYLKK